MHRTVRNIALLIAVALSTTSCFKKVTTATTLCIKVREEVPVMMKELQIDNTTGEEKEILKEVRKDILPAEGCYAYLYNTGGGSWYVESYEDAAAKIVTNAANGEKRTQPESEGSPYFIEGSNNNYISLYQQEKGAIIVVVYPAAQMYAYMYRWSEAENLPTTYLTLIFHTWKSGNYNEGSKDGHKWIVVAPETSVRPPIIEEPEQPEEPETPETPEIPEIPNNPDTPAANN